MAVLMLFCALPLGSFASDVKVPEDAVEFNGNYYKVYEESMIWSKAKSYCESIGGHLVVITSKEEQDFLIKLTNSSSKRNMWIGAYP